MDRWQVVDDAAQVIGAHVTRLDPIRDVGARLGEGLRDAAGEVAAGRCHQGHLAVITASTSRLR
jgi:hypothetical protein